MDEVKPLHPASLAFTLLLGLLVLVVPRRYAIVPIVIGGIFIPADQRIVILTLDWQMFRLLILFAFTRLLVRGEFAPFKLLPIDYCVFALAIWTIVARTVLFGQVGVTVNALGRTFETIGIYVVARMLFRTWRDLTATIQVVLACTVILAAFMSLEAATGRNLFAAIGGVPFETVIREGRLRCQGAFAHPIMAGVFGATWFPLFVAFWWLGQRPLAIIGAAGATVVTFASASSTPVMALILSILALAAWPIRWNLRQLRWATLALGVVLHFAREKPIWHLISRLNVVGGSTGWHRYNVMDQAIRHWHEWVLLGAKTIDHWGIWANDVTNEYVVVGIGGGLIAMGLFIAIIAYGFQGAGAAAKSRVLNPAQRRLSWCIGAMLFSHAVSFTSVSYFGQMRTVFYLQLGIVASLAELHRNAKRKAARERRAVRVASFSAQSEEALSRAG
jgi:hypothetical protein